MDTFIGKTAFVTGGASGIGLALARAFANEGMRVALSDIDGVALETAAADLRSGGAEVVAIVCDVSDAGAVAQAANDVIDAFGEVHILCNNAGVAGPGGVDEISLETWRWVLDINVMGVVHGIKAFLPHLRAHPGGGHIVNTASMAGLQSGGGFSPYSASKYAVVSISEGLQKQLAPLGIGVSVVCPSFVRTRIAESGRNRQAQYGASVAPIAGSRESQMLAWISAQIESGLDPAIVAERTVRAVRSNELYVFTHPGWYWEVEERFEAIRQSMARWAQ